MSNYAKPIGHTFASIHDRAWALVCEAEEAGIVLEIKPVSMQPLAMGNTLMMVSMRPARIREKPIQRLDIQAMAADAMERVRRRIAEQCEFEKSEVREGIADAFEEMERRTYKTARDAMARQGRAWTVKPFQRYRMMA